MAEIQTAMLTGAGFGFSLGVAWAIFRRFIVDKIMNRKGEQNGKEEEVDETPAIQHNPHGPTH